MAWAAATVAAAALCVLVAPLALPLWLLGSMRRS